MTASRYQPTGKLEVEWQEGESETVTRTAVRLCADCGALVGDLAAHDEWHAAALRGEH